MRLVLARLLSRLMRFLAKDMTYEEGFEAGRPAGAEDVLKHTLAVVKARMLLAHEAAAAEELLDVARYLSDTLDNPLRWGNLDDGWFGPQRERISPTQRMPL